LAIRKSWPTTKSRSSRPSTEDPARLIQFFNFFIIKRNLAYYCCLSNLIESSYLKAFLVYCRVVRLCLS
jgi:hypothetical protein